VTKTQCQKLLFSATLTRDPSKIAALKLNDPQYFIIQDEGTQGPTEHVEGEVFAVPATLKESFLVSPTLLKPLALLHLLHSPTFALRNVLCFTKSVESAARLAKLLQFYELERIRNGGSTRPGEGRCVAKSYSSELGAGKGGERAKVLREFKEGAIDV
jgi:ATP-dependent RNA helicase DDX51/DBP6